MEQNQQPQKKKNSLRPVVIILIIMIVLLSGGGGYLVYQYLQTQKKYDGLVVEKIELDETITQQNQELDSLKTELEALQGGIPQEVADSLYNVISQLEADLADAKASRIIYTGGGGGNRSQEIESLKEEIAAIRAEWEKDKSKLASLTSENERLQGDVSVLNQEKTDLAKVNKGLQDKVDKASELRFFDTQITGFRVDKKGRKKYADKTKKITGLEVSFKIQENLVADEGERMAYIVINGPNKKTLAESAANVFEYNGADKVFSMQKAFYFNNKVAEISADFKTAEKLKKGEYTVEIYVDGKLAGTGATYFKK